MKAIAPSPVSKLKGAKAAPPKVAVVAGASDGTHRFDFYCAAAQCDALVLVSIRSSPLQRLQVQSLRFLLRLQVLKPEVRGLVRSCVQEAPLRQVPLPLVLLLWEGLPSAASASFALAFIFEARSAAAAARLFASTSLPAAAAPGIQRVA
eukprot:CAMPEP_0183377664 /NCGR_PEP_ID=MMETSP0164_2-20130417/123618_1 /TAXON_ID=221442 /ORGANISM="Coccolithus pelagicus ssp braarudi, Strain PLY182g" /LENGTH=149 /DNA_ID=CAMNT_0025555149 /DNA_START=191 /DNA_END=635 /DNA_ORIENTATION=+